MGRPSAAGAQAATPERLLQAAEAIFAAVGYGTAKLADIAGRAGIRRPSLLYHFPSKEQLYAATVERAFARLRAALGSAMQAEGEFSDRLMNTVQRYCDFVADEPELSRLVLRELLDEHGPGRVIVIRHIVPLLDVVERWIRSESGSATPEDAPVRQAILMIASDVFLRSAVGPLRDQLWGPQDRARELAGMLFLPKTQE
jgi:AcrR family transcriptional regulator